MISSIFCAFSDDASSSLMRICGFQRVKAAARHVKGQVWRAVKERQTMQGGNRILDDFARIMTDAAGMAQGVKREAEGVVKAQFERMIRDMDLVTREEFEAVREMAQLAREENDRLLSRIEALENSKA
jgi:BMFP domain-containing protein YqiC